jgi:uncharacterized protein YyaL (SSP411 family)
MGGIYDQLGLGFHRYSTDREWLVPHFEKMLYDQALLLVSYAEAHQATGNGAFAEIAREIAAYVRRDLTSPDGAFYSAEDADSEGEEGKFYVWTRGEVETVLGSHDRGTVEAFCRAFGVRSEGNWVDEASGTRPGTNILHVADESAFRLRDVPPGAAMQERMREVSDINHALRLLLRARNERVRPHRDDKILTSWNGLMVGALAIASRALGRSEYALEATRALSFVMTHLVREDGRLLARYRDGEAAHPGYLDDYAFLLWGTIELYQATFMARHLETAVRLARDMDRLFRDEEGGGYFFTGVDRDEALLARTKESYDGALPSGNSIAASALLRLAHMTGDRTWEERARSIFQAFSGAIASLPSAHTQMLAALDFALGPAREIVIVSEERDEEASRMAREATRRFLPRTVVLWNVPSQREALREFAPGAAAYDAVYKGKATAYVCENFSCRAPVTTVGELAVSLEDGAPPSAPTPEAPS